VQRGGSLLAWTASFISNHINGSYKIMKCTIHPYTSIQYHEITQEKRLPWSDEFVKTYHEKPYCPECFEEYTITGIYQENLTNNRSNYGTYKQNVTK
jgi:hypothetical protein